MPRFPSILDTRGGDAWAGMRQPGFPVPPNPFPQIGPKQVSFTAAPQSGLPTIQALQQRQEQIAPPVMGDIQTPEQGWGYLANEVVSGILGNRAASQEEQQRQLLAQIAGSIDPVAGPTMEQATQAMQIDPEGLGKELYAMAIAARQPKEKWEPVPGQPGIQRNVLTGETKSAGLPEGAGGAKITDESTMRGQVQRLPSYQNMANAEPMWMAIQDAATRDTAQADLNMIIGVAKIFDPTSVVRTEEGEMVRDTGGLPQGLYGEFLRLTGTQGARLAPEVRAGMLQEARGRMQGYNQAWQRDKEMYTRIALDAGIDPKLIVPTFAEVTAAEDTETDPAQTDDTTVPPPAKMPVITPDGKVDYSGLTEADRAAANQWATENPDAFKKWVRSQMGATP